MLARWSLGVHDCVRTVSLANCMVSTVFSQFSWLVDCPLETMRWQADASSRVAAPRRRLVGRVPFPAARAAQPSEHEDLLGNR